jgi:hypothetical protein
MEQIIECFIAGGPQHGLIRHQLWDPQYPLPPVMASGDGAVCTAVACHHANPENNRFLLAHPRATGQQILAMMTMLNTQPVNPILRLVVDADQSLHCVDADYAIADSG